MASTEPKSKSLQSNLDVDYVVSYSFLDTPKQVAQQGLEKLIQALARVGLTTSVRAGESSSVLVFVKAADPERFKTEVYKQRVKDWLHGLRAAQPDRETQDDLASTPLTDAERYRIIHHLISGPVSEGGAGIIPGDDEWKNVKSVFALHDHAFNKHWMTKWSTTTFLKPEDLDEIRDKVGEKVAFYFAFTQSYFAFLIFPAVFGFSAWVLLGGFSPVYAIVSSLWCVTFVEYWKKQETDLGVRWGVRGVSEIQEKRREFKHEAEIKDPITGETKQVFPAFKRLGRQALAIPFALLAILALGTIIATCFGIEIFISEIYSGPFKSVLVYLPTVLLTTFIPTMSTFLTTVATKINDYENYETAEGYKTALTAKIFILNFITSYLPIILTAFVYVPFATVLVPYLDVFHVTARAFAQNEKQLKVPKAGAFSINPNRLKNQVIYFTVTAQVVNLALETVVPYVKRKGVKKIQDMKAERAASSGGSYDVSLNDHDEEREFLSRVRNEADLPEYNVADDLREMVVQFGYLALFSVVWPLVPVSFIINNWIELRADAFKICIESKRPTPYRSDGIGPWLESLSFLAWLGSLTSAAIVYLFSNGGLGPDGNPATIKGWALLLTMFFSEHIYLIVRLAVRTALAKIDSPGVNRERAERYQVRKRYLQEQFGDNALELPPKSNEKITRQSLEEDARTSSLQSATPTSRFWARQRGWEESVQVGSNLIEKMRGDEGKKAK